MIQTPLSVSEPTILSCPVRVQPYECRGYANGYRLGQYALAAIDGSNATTWQPLTNATSNMTIDLGSSQSIKAFHFNWNANPAQSYALYGGKSSGSMAALANGSVSISAPYDAANAEAVSIKLGNLTDVQLNKTITARYLTVSITGSYLADGKGATLAEFAVI